MSEFSAEEYFTQSIEREKSARRAKGMSEELGEDVIHFLAEIAKEKADRHV